MRQTSLRGVCIAIALGSVVMAVETQAECSITASAVLTACVNEGVDNNPNNDTYTVRLTVSATEASSAFSYVSSPLGVSGSNIPYVDSPVLSSAIIINSTPSPLTLTVLDSVDPSCRVTTNEIVEPGTCSTPGLTDLELKKTVKKVQ